MKKIFLLILFFCIFRLTTICACAQEVPGTGLFPGALDTTGSLFNTKNNAVSSLVFTITAGSASITVTTGSKFPSSSFSIIIDSEIIYCTTRSGNAITGLTRGAAGTTAASHTAGVSVRSPILAEQHNILASQLVATQTKLGYTASTPAGNTVLAGISAGESAWTGTPTLTRVTFATGGEAPPSLTDITIGSRLTLYAGAAPDHLAYGVESGALWTNVGAANSLKWYFGAVQKHIMTTSGLALNASSLNAAAIFQADSTTRGMLPPRMTTTQRDAIASPPEGLRIHNLTTHQGNYYNGTTWVAF